MPQRGIFLTVLEDNPCFLNVSNESSFSMHSRLGCHSHIAVVFTSSCMSEGGAGVQHISAIR